jgi:23S rRNA (cytosine1962-C5)-methyltransferase
MTECTIDPAVQADVVLKQRRAQPFFGRHPWVFAGAIDRVVSTDDSPLLPGAVVRLVTSDERFVAYGMWNEVSRIRVRLYSWAEDQPLTREFWEHRLAAAVDSRRIVFDLNDPQSACRLVFSESDGLSGLTVDRYGDYVLVQFTSRAMYELREVILESLAKLTHAKGLWLRTERGMREAEGLEVSDGLVVGEPPPRPLFIAQNGVSFGVDVQQGQKTGCYLDQRNNHLSVSRYLKDAELLDAFCFSGGFGITALCAGGAKSVTGVDSSEPALLLATENAALNDVASHCEWIRSDVHAAFEEFASNGRLFDAVIIDPPRMARTRRGLDRAVQGYARLNEAALTVLKPNGILVTCSCSGLVSRPHFQDMLAHVSRKTGRDIRVLESLGQPADHPVIATCPETEYLKVMICQVN